MTVKQLIIKNISAKDSIDVEEFIQISLFSDNGYYIKNNPIGEKGDFITAPEISQMYGEILGLFIINYWNEKINKDFNLIELGPGKGTLLKDLLRVAKKKPKFLSNANITIVEKNKHLISFQKDSFNNKIINWIKEFDIPYKKLPSIIYSNEFFDCFPVRQFFKKEKWYEKLIKYNNSKKNFNFISKKVESIKLLKTLEKFDHVKVAEISERRLKYFNLICNFIKKYKGVFITIDYGYIKPPNYMTLQTMYNHKKTHLFENIGNQDITAHVNFDELICVAKKYNLKIDLFCTQKEFLISYGIKKRKFDLKKNKSEKIINKLNLDYNRLVSKSQMGEIFKVLVISCL